jgi:hypothetical protein
VDVAENWADELQITILMGRMMINEQIWIWPIFRQAHVLHLGLNTFFFLHHPQFVGDDTPAVCWQKGGDHQFKRDDLLFFGGMYHFGVLEHHRDIWKTG